jgi:triosephosphate isomerase
MREVLVKRFGAEGARMRLLYGGSVKPDNAAEIGSIVDVDGALVGGASLKSNDFLAIIATYKN